MSMCKCGSQGLMAEWTQLKQLKWRLPSKAFTLSDRGRHPLRCCVLQPDWVPELCGAAAAQVMSAKPALEGLTLCS